MAISFGALNRFEASLSDIEKGLNFLGYVPGLNVISGGLRITVGKLQAIAGLAVTCFSYLASEMSTNPEKRAKFEAIYIRSFEHVKHGLANIFRGVIEAGAPFSAGGLAIWLSYDLQHRRMEYIGEKNSPEHLPKEEYTLSDVATAAKELVTVFN